MSWPLCALAGEVIMPSVRPSVSSRYQLVLDGVPVGLVKSVEGGATRATVLSKDEPSDHFVKKFIGEPIYEPVSVLADLSMEDQTLYQWIEAQWAGKYLQKTVSIVESDYNFVSQLAHDFLNARISEVTIPSLDGSAKGGAFLTVQFSPELTRSSMGSGTTAGTVGKPTKKRWMRSNFRLEVDGLDCTTVSKIDSFTVKQSLQTTLDEGRASETEVRPINFPNVRVTFAVGNANSDASATSWMKWFEDFVVQGHSGEGNLKSGSLVFLSTNLEDELGRINFHNLGIAGLERNPSLSRDTTRSMTAELYCDWMEFVVRP